MKKYQRPIISTIIKYLRQDSKRLSIIMGPRQTGKTTVLLQALEQIDCPHSYFAVDEPQSEASGMFLGASRDLTTQSEETVTAVGEEKNARWLVRKWEEARTKAVRSARGFVLAFDEIQKIPNWSEAVKGLWDADRRKECPLHVVLLGSAPLLMQKGLGESLVGRFESIHLTHWSFTEMSEAFKFDLPSYIYFGGYPGAASITDDQNKWRKYISDSFVQPNINRDILAMNRVDKPALLKNLFELAASSSGQILSYNKMLGQLQDAGNTTTMAHYLNLLSNTGLITGLPKYAGAAHRRRASSPKLNVLNTALMSVYSGYTFEEAWADRSFWGRLVESSIGAHLLNTAEPDIQLYYWRHGNYEVDFVLELGRRLVAFEVKSGVRRTSISGLKEFEKQFKPLRCEVVGGNGISIERFLSVPASNWFKIS